MRRTQRGHRTRKRQRFIALGIALAVLAACGSRANQAQIVEALGAGGGGGTGGGVARATASGGPTGVGGTSGTGGTGGVDATAGGAGGTGGGGGAGGGFTGDNGGATDVGVTANSITVANISILTGPVPGLFAGAVNGTDAYFAYQNSQGGMFGRELKLLAQDDQFDCGINKAIAEEDVNKVFGFVGSFSLFDACSGEVLQAHPDIPDIHNPLSSLAQSLPNNFPAQPIRRGGSTGPFQYIKDKFFPDPNSPPKVGTLVGDVDVAKEAWENVKYVIKQLGYEITYERIFEPLELDFTNDILVMQQRGVNTLALQSADVKAMGNILKAADKQGWHPTVRLLGAAGYDNTLFLNAGGNAPVEGAILFVPTAMYLGEDRASVPEVDLFLTWLERTHPGANVDLFTAYGWVSARLFVQALEAAGPKATRVGLIDALKQIDSFDANGLLAPGGPASHTPPSCYIMAQARDGKFERLDSPSGFRCDGTYVYRP